MCGVQEAEADVADANNEEVEVTLQEVSLATLPVFRPLRPCLLVLHLAKK